MKERLKKRFIKKLYQLTQDKPDLSRDDVTELLRNEISGFDISGDNNTVTINQKLSLAPTDSAPEEHIERWQRERTRKIKEMSFGLIDAGFAGYQSENNQALKLQDIYIEAHCQRSQALDGKDFSRERASDDEENVLSLKTL